MPYKETNIISKNPFIAESEYMVFVEIKIPNRKTKTITVRSKRNKNILACIRWHGAWRQYIFEPSNDTLFNIACLKNINDVIESLTNERKKEKA